jgi:hypothetical protein
VAVDFVGAGEEGTSPALFCGDLSISCTWSLTSHTRSSQNETAHGSRTHNIFILSNLCELYVRRKSG